MKTRLLVLLFGIATTLPLTAADQPAADALIKRGRYLVEGVGLCADCHTPRNEKGEFLTALSLRGAPIGFTPAMPMPWAPVAPPIAGLPSMTAEQAVQFLMQGKRPDGSLPRPPMPPYRLNEGDARAMVAYLKSLGDAPVAVAATKP